MCSGQTRSNNILYRKQDIKNGYYHLIWYDVDRVLFWVMQWTPKIWWVYKPWVVSFCHYRQVVDERVFEMDKFSFMNQWRILSCSVVVVFLFVFCLWLRAFFLSVSWCARQRAPPVCGMKDVWGGQDDMPHTVGHLAHETKVRQEGEEDKMNDSRQGQGRRRSKWLLAKGT